MQRCAHNGCEQAAADAAGARPVSEKEIKKAAELDFGQLAAQSTASDQVRLCSLLLVHTLY